MCTLCIVTSCDINHLFFAFYATDWYNRSGSPTVSISGMVHFRSKALLRTILKIFCTLMLWLVLLKIKLARMALANLRAYTMLD